MKVIVCGSRNADETMPVFTVLALLDQRGRGE